MSNIQIPESVFCALCRSYLYDMRLEQDTKLIREALQTKLDAITKRQLYTTYKTADTANEREKARQEYLDIAGISKNFRW